MLQCAAALGIKYNPIQKCAEGTQGDELLAGLGNRTHNFTPHITFVPTVAINDVSVIPIVVTNLYLNKFIIKLLITVNSIKCKSNIKYNWDQSVSFPFLLLHITEDCFEQESKYICPLSSRLFHKATTAFLWCSPIVRIISSYWKFMDASADWWVTKVILWMNSLSGINLINRFFWPLSDLEWTTYFFIWVYHLSQPK